MQGIFFFCSLFRYISPIDLFIFELIYITYDYSSWVDSNCIFLFCLQTDFEPQCHVFRTKQLKKPRPCHLCHQSMIKQASCCRGKSIIKLSVFPTRSPFYSLRIFSQSALMFTFLAFNSKLINKPSSIIQLIKNNIFLIIPSYLPLAFSPSSGSFKNI